MKNHLNQPGRKPKPILNIAVDCGSLSAPLRERGGISTLTYNLLVMLGKIDQRNKYIFYSYSPLNKNLLVKYAGRAKNIVLPKIGFFKVWLPLALKINKSDAFFALSQSVPANAPSTLGFIYDLAFFRFRKM